MAVKGVFPFTSSPPRRLRRRPSLARRGETIKGTIKGVRVEWHLLSVNTASDGLSMPRAVLKIDSFPRQRGKVGMGAMPPAKTPPSQLPPRMRRKERDRRAISVIAVEKLSIRRLSKCHSGQCHLISGFRKINDADPFDFDFRFDFV